MFGKLKILPSQVPGRGWQMSIPDQDYWYAALANLRRFPDALIEIPGNALCEPTEKSHRRGNSGGITCCGARNENPLEVPPKASSDLLVGWGREKVFSFDSFQLFPRRFLLLKTGKSIRIASRAFEISVALLERRGESASKQASKARMWPNALVEEANLTVQVTNLRRALGDSRDGSRFLINITGRGYRFVGPVAIGA